MGIRRILFEIKRFGGFFFRAAQELLTSGWKRRNARYARYCQHMHIKQNTIVYEAFFGRGLLCGPYALFNEMLQDPAYADYQHVWVLDDPDRHTDTIEKYQNYKNVRFVEYLSRDYLKALASAQYVINNTTFPSFFTKRPGQIYINTWHGIPVKHLGYDMPNGVEETSNIIRNFLEVDYLISASPFLTQIYREAYKLDGIFEGKILEGGYPRLDTLIKSDPARIKIKLIHTGINIDPDKKIALYAPTWKAGNDDPAKIACEYSAIKTAIETAAPEYQVLIKAHHYVYQILQDYEPCDYIIPATIDANEILPLADVLISDYSSIFFDYLYFKRPILFYIPDIKQYLDTRGLYIKLDDLPGPYTQDLSTLTSWMSDIDSIRGQYEEKIDKSRKYYCADQAGNICSNILQTIITGESCVPIVDDLSGSKEKILISRGRMMVNGISTSFLNLLKSLDYDKYDITLTVSSTNDPLEKELIQEIDPRARVLMRASTFNFRYFDNVENRIAIEYGYRGLGKKLFPHRAYELETRRCFGDATFDYAIDFEGYNLAYAMIVQAVPNAVRSIWQHNDMESERITKHPYLTTIFSIYPLFDRVVSCSKAIMEVNRSNLATPATYDSYHYARNMLDFDRIYSKLVHTDPVMFEGIPCSVAEQKCEVNREIFTLIPLLPFAEEDKSSQEDSLRPYRFITIGRLSLEKNQNALIKAFARFRERYPMSMLYIVGEGNSRPTLESTISNLDLDNSVILTGNIANPYPLMSQCDCFVLPSTHEGQPMVLFEARALKLPIIVSSFSSIEGAVFPEGQLIIGTSETDIYNGLIAFSKGEVPNSYSFDEDAYNKEGYHEFLVAIGALK